MIKAKGLELIKKAVVPDRVERLGKIQTDRNGTPPLLEAPNNKVGEGYKCVRGPKARPKAELAIAQNPPVLKYILNPGEKKRLK